MAEDRFQWPDYLVLVMVLVLSVGIGVFQGLRRRKNQTTDEYLMGGRKLNVVPVAFSVMASFVSAITVLGGPVEIYVFGASFWVNSLSYFISVPITAHVFIPLFHKLQLKSVYEYLEMRFNTTIRILGSLVFTIQMVFYMAVVFYAPALAFSQVTGMSVPMAIVVTGLVCTFYTTLGGLRAVVWTDLFQMLVVLGGMLALVIQGVVEVGGASEVWRKAEEGGRLHVFDFDPNPLVRHTFWTLVVGGSITTLSVYAVNQAMVQRYLCVHSLRQAQATIYFNLPGNILCTTLIAGLGLVAYAKYQGCDPLTQGRIKTMDQMVPLLVMETLGVLPGMAGFFVACVYSAALSTVSSGVNALALVHLEDLVKPAFRRLRGVDMTETSATWTSRGLAMLFGLLTVAMAFVTSAMGQTLVTVTLKIFGMTGGPLLAVFLLAIFFPSANAWGAAIGLLVSLSFSFWIVVGAIIANPPLPILKLSIDKCPLDNLTAVTSLTNVTTAGVTSFPDITTDVTSMFSNASDVTTVAAVAAKQYTGLALYQLSYLWYSGACVLIGIVVGIIVSYITGGRRGRELNPSLVIPLWQKLASLVCKSRQYSVSTTVSNANTENHTLPNTPAAVNGDSQKVEVKNSTEPSPQTSQL